ncbi:hypothetical protein BH10PLA1_BH10PLA1_03390 [soil metagenome]
MSRFKILFSPLGTVIVGTAFAVFVVLAGLGYPTLATGVLVVSCSLAVIAVTRWTVSRFHREVRNEDIKHMIVNVATMQALRNRFGKDIPVISGASMQPANLSILLDFMDDLQPKKIVELGCGTSTFIVSAWLKHRPEGRLISFDHLSGWTDVCRKKLKAMDLADRVDLNIVPLVPTEAMGRKVPWYDLSDYDALLRDVDLLIVDGPPGIHTSMARFPAFHYFKSRMSASAAIYLDDGHREDEKTAAMEWGKARPDLQPTFFDTLTGCWVIHPNK